MSTRAEKTQKNKNPALAKRISQKQNSSTTAFQLADNRPEAVAQKKLNDIANDSPQVKKAAQLKALANDNSGNAVTQLVRMGGNFFIGEHRDEEGNIIKEKAFTSRKKAEQWEQDKSAMPTSGAFERNLKKMILSANKKLGNIPKSQTLRAEYVKALNKAQVIKAQGGLFHHYAPQLANLVGTGVKAGTSALGGLFAPLTGGASTMGASALNMITGAGTKKAVEKLKDFNFEKALSAYSFLGSEGEEELKSEESGQQEAIDGKTGERQHVPGIEGKVIELIPHVQKAAESAADKGIDAIGDVIDPSGGAITKAAKKGFKATFKFVLGKLAKKGKNKLSEFAYQELKDEDEL